MGSASRLSGVGWPLTWVRGQISRWRHAGRARIERPRLPITGAGYVLPGIDDGLVFGATSAPGDPDPAVRRQDHLENLAQLRRLLPALAGAALRVDDLEGRTAWRCSSLDRLPLIGAVPLISDLAFDEALSQAAPALQPRFVPRAPGLYVFSALGSRGITWSAFGAQVLAARISGAPVPLESALLDAVDPARFLVRTSRRHTTLTPGD